MIELTRTEEYLAFTEQDAYNFIEEKRKEYEVVSSSIKFKKETKNTFQCWIVTIKVKLNDLKENIENGE